MAQVQRMCFVGITGLLAMCIGMVAVGVGYAQQGTAAPEIDDIRLMNAEVVADDADRPAPDDEKYAGPVSCERNIKASVVAFDQPLMWNRLGSTNPQGAIYALEQDTKANTTAANTGQRMVRSYKRPRPIVLRANVGDCITIAFTNYLYASLPPYLTNANGSLITGTPMNTRTVGLHIMGLDLVHSIESDGSWVGRNPSSLADPGNPGQTRYYTYYAGEEGVFMITSFDDTTLLEAGLYGAITVQPRNAEWYRSQVTNEDLYMAAYRVETINGRPVVVDDSLNRVLAPRRTPESGYHEQEDKAMWLRGYFYSDSSDVAYDEAVDLWTMTTFVEGTKRRAVRETPVVIVPHGNDHGHLYTELGQPIINYQAKYPANYGTGTDKAIRAGKPILNMLADTGSDTLEIVHTDLTAIITGPNSGRFPYTDVSPTFYENPASPDRRQPYREIVLHYFTSPNNTVYPFEQFYLKSLGPGTLQNGSDNFGLNYGIAGIATEILANRLGVGPMGNRDAVDMKFEEFFLSSWAVGDPGMVVDVPANVPNQVVDDPDGNLLVDKTKLTQVTGTPPQFAPSSNLKATKAFYPDDPSNVYHTYMRDHTKFRILNASPGHKHVHHQHAHQWLHTPNSDNSHYRDSQMIVPGATYTLEMVYNGSGNRNQTVGDAIFHCHFYQHFAKGMWALWRVHDTFEEGTELDASGRPAVPQYNAQGHLTKAVRALPDGEIERGTPTPAVVPVPTISMAPMPAPVGLTDLPAWIVGDQRPGVTYGQGRRVHVEPERDHKGDILYDEYGQPVYESPGFPFYIPGVAGHRPPHPPIDFAWEVDEDGLPVLDSLNQKKYLDGGLPRHIGLNGDIVKERHTRWDFTKDFIRYSTEDINEKNEDTIIGGGFLALQLPEEGTLVEKAGMKANATRAHASYLPDGDPGNFILNGLPPVPGAPFAEPGVDDAGNSVINNRRYQGANIQLDVVLNKKGWHYPQQRMITLWEDVEPTFTGERPPQPFFFRANTGETVEYWQTNLVPNYYDMDDFQVRTPTDIIGQHIHLVKFDVMASDGAANGFNYEDGTFAADEVRERIEALNFASTPKPYPQHWDTNEGGGLYLFDHATQFISDTMPPPSARKELHVKPADPVYGDPPFGQNWDGAQTTVQRWDTDPLLNNLGVDRTLRTVFTHDHFSPSTHQQIGLYAGLIVEPESSVWLDPVSGDTMYTRPDGGPTGWQANIITADPADSYREFLLEFQDLQLAYTYNSRPSLAHLSDPAANPNAPSVFSDTTAATVPAMLAGLSSGTITAPLSEQFSLYGLVLHDPSVVDIIADSVWAVLSEPLDGARRDSFVVVKSTVGDTGFRVYAPQLRSWADPPTAIYAPPVTANTSYDRAPTPNLVSVEGPSNGTYSLNYRNEPLPYRVQKTQAQIRASNFNAGAPVQAGDLAYAYASIERFDNELNVQPPLGQTVTGAPCPSYTSQYAFCFPDTPLSPDMQPMDPWTPLLRAYANDKIQVRTLVGAHVQTHSLELQGVKWFFEPSFENSGYRNVQPMGLSEHYEMLFHMPPASQQNTQASTDYLYAPSVGTFGQTSGIWGLMRSYTEPQSDLLPLPNNPVAQAAVRANYEPPAGATIRTFHVVALTVQQALGGDYPLIYNERGQSAGTNGIVAFNTARINDPNAVIYVRAEDLDGPNGTGKLKNAAQIIASQVPNGDGYHYIEPLILRAAAGEWMEVKLTNRVNTSAATFSTPSNSLKPFINSGSPDQQQFVGPIPLSMSKQVGLHPQLVGYDYARANGINVGRNYSVADPNSDATVAPGQSKTFYWYAGSLDFYPKTGTFYETPIEFGAINLVAAEPLVQHTRGVIGALIIEPAGSRWVEDANYRHSSATVTMPHAKYDSTQFREFVVLMQNDLAPNNASGGTGAINYRMEPRGYRYSNVANPFPTTTPPLGISETASNMLVTGGQVANTDPRTPVFKVDRGMPVRMRVLFPGGNAQDSEVFAINGHGWQEEPFQKGSTVLGFNDRSQYFGSQQFVPNQPMNLLLGPAGGAFKIPGDYLYYAFLQQPAGLWGIMRVSDSLYVNHAGLTPTNELVVRGYAQAHAPGAPVTLCAPRSETSTACTPLGTARAKEQGQWQFGPQRVPSTVRPGDLIRAETTDGQRYTIRLPKAYLPVEDR